MSLALSSLGCVLTLPSPGDRPLDHQWSWSKDDEERQQCMAVNVAQDFQLVVRELWRVRALSGLVYCSGSIKCALVQCRGTEWVPVRLSVVCLIGKTYKHSSQMEEHCCYNELASTQCPAAEPWETVPRTWTPPRG